MNSKQASLDNMIINLGEMLNSAKESQDINYNILTPFSVALRLKDEYTEQHCSTVTNFAVILGKELGLADNDLFRVEIASLLHDLGKIFLPGKILRTKKKLSEGEMGIIRTHPYLGAERLRKSPYLENIAIMVLCHHIRPDGKGYPEIPPELIPEDVKNLKNVPSEYLYEFVPLGAKIISVTDAYDAMIRERFYREESVRVRTPEEALREIVRCSGTQFDSKIAQKFVLCMEKYEVKL